MPNPPEPSGGYLVAGVLRPQKLTHAEVSAKGGRARSRAKREAVLHNLEKAKEARAARRQASAG
jgi:hypothetical protein